MFHKPPLSFYLPRDCHPHGMLKSAREVLLLLRRCGGNESRGNTPQTGSSQHTGLKFFSYLKWRFTTANSNSYVLSKQHPSFPSLDSILPFTSQLWKLIPKGYLHEALKSMQISPHGIPISTNHTALPILLNSTEWASFFCQLWLQ